MDYSVDRREALLSAVGMALTATDARGAAVATDPFQPDRLMADVERYASFGIHQTGSPGERATGAWIADRMRSLGLTVSTMPIQAPFFDPRTTSLKGDGWLLPGIAQAPVTATGTDGLTAPLHMRYDAADDTSLAGTIAVVRLPFGRHASVASPLIAGPLAAAKRSGAKAVVLITTGPTGLPIALNAGLETPFEGMPVLLVGSQQGASLIPRARAGERATLIIDGELGSRPSENVVGRRPGPGRSVVMTTPLSGWFRCAGERGSGIAAWLAFAATLPQAFPKLDFTFAGMVGHERENIGSKEFLSKAAPAPSKVALWQHFGSGFATRDWQEAGPDFLLPLPSADAQRWLIASPPFLSTVKRSTKGLPGFEQPYPADAKSAAGEAMPILAAGYERIIASYAGHRFFHTERDGPEATSGKLISETAIALHRAVVALLATA